MDHFINTSELARSIGGKPNTVVVVAKRLGIPKLGRDYLFTEQQAKQVAAHIHGRTGRPPGPRPWLSEGISRQAWYLRRQKERQEAKPKERVRPRSTRAKDAAGGNQEKTLDSPEIS